MDVGRGTFAYYGTLPGAGSSLCLVALQANEADGTLQTRTTLAALLAASGNTEANFTNYGRIFVTTGVTVTIASHVTTLTCPNQTWANAGGATNNTLTKIIVCYKPSSGAADSAIIPLGQFDFSAVTDTSNLTAQVNVNGLLAAA